MSYIFKLRNYNLLQLFKLKTKGAKSKGKSWNETFTKKNQKRQILKKLFTSKQNSYVYNSGQFYIFFNLKGWLLEKKNILETNINNNIII